MTSKKKVWTHDELNVLNAVVAPVWVYSCATNKLVWGNKATLQYFSRTLDQFTTYKFRLTTEEHAKFQVLNNLIRDEVEVGSAEQTLSGFGHSVLPGVIPQDGLSSSEYLYRPIILSLPGSDTMLCTLVQPANHASLASNRIKAVQARRPHSQEFSTGSDGKLPPKSAGTPTVANLVELMESIISKGQVDMDVVQAFHQALLRGDIVAQSSRLQEELVCKEELDQDVGLNLLQLLGSSKNIGEQYLADSFNSYAGDAVLNSQMSCTARSMEKEEAHGHGHGHEEDKEFVAPSLLPVMEAVLATVDEWRFDAFKLAEVTHGHPLSALGFWLMKRYDLIDSLQLDATKLARFLRKIEDSYPDNPYHNKAHAADVLQGMHTLLTRGGLSRRLNEEFAMLAGYFAAIIHDNEHKGLNNDFLVRVSDDLALTYNDISPMENHHVASTFKLLKHNDYNFLKKVPRDKMVRLRRLLIDMVLATDMKQHFNILSKFQAKLQVKLRSSNYSSSLAHMEMVHKEDPLLLMDDEADRSLVLQVALKCADVGHLAAPWDIHHRWVSGLEEEFFRQGDKEKMMHMMVSPLMDRCKDGITKSQVGFFDIVALPLFYSWASVFPDSLQLVRAVEDNCNRWRQLEMGRSNHASK